MKHVQNNGAQKDHKSIFDLVAESGNPEAAKIKTAIEEVKKNRKGLIDQIKKLRSRINYKQSEGETIEKLLQMGNMARDYGDNQAKLRVLHKQKQRLDFRISTEAFSLTAEKDLVRKIKELNKEIEEALRVVRLFRKRDYIKKDLDEFSVQLKKLDTDIANMDKQLDDLYSNLRKILMVGGREKRIPTPQKRQKQKPEVFEVNMEDIAVIKKKKA